MLLRLIQCLVALGLLLTPVDCSYILSNFVATPTGWTGTLTLTPTATNTTAPQDYQTLQLSIFPSTNSRLRVLIAPYQPSRRWQVPPELLDVPVPSSTVGDLTDYTVLTQSNPFGFAVIRNSTKTILFDSRNASLTFQEQYLEISTQLPKGHAVYGLGERITSLRLSTNTTYTILNKDQGNPTLYGLYGAHPVYYRLEGDGNAHAVFLFNSNPMDVVLGETQLTYKVVGGVFDFYILTGPTPALVQDQYTQLVGRPYLPPLWALGWHQCRWGYQTIDDTRQVVLDYEKNNLPLDTIWSDIDYMDSYYMFTFSPSRFNASATSNFANFLAQRGQHRVYILDPGVPVVTSSYSGSPYSSFNNGLAANVFVRTPDNSSVLQSRVWPHVNVAFPDFSSPSTQAWWTSEIAAWAKEGGHIDGLWNDMNEVSSFCLGQWPDRCENVTGPAYSDPPPSYIPPPNIFPVLNRTSAPSVIPDPAYVPGGAANTPFTYKTINMSSIHTWSQHYNMHNLYGYLESRASTRALEEIRGKRAFVLTRSTFAGSGRYAAHWTGDNNSNFASMKSSIASVLAMGLFGIPFVGADICGFNDNTTIPLCSRWMQLGSLYPFSRNHNTFNTIPQEPYALGPDVLAASKFALEQRYSLLSYYYTAFAKSHYDGTPVWQTLFTLYPKDSATYSIENQFFIGDSLLAIPVVDEGVSSVTGYIPNDDFFDYHSGALVHARSSFSASGTYLSFSAPLHAPLPLLQRGGSIIPLLTPGLTTGTSVFRYNELRIALTASSLSSSSYTHSATGSLFADDGESLTSFSASDYSKVAFDAKFDISTLTGVVNATVLNRPTSAPIAAVTAFGIVTIYGLPLNVTSSTLDITLTGNQISLSNADVKSSYDNLKKVLSIVVLNNKTFALDPHLGFSFSFTVRPVSPSSTSSSSSLSLLLTVVIVVLSVLGGLVLIALIYCLCCRKSSDDKNTLDSQLEPMINRPDAETE